MNPMAMYISKTLAFILLLLISGCVHIADFISAKEGECEQNGAMCKLASNPTRSLKKDEPVEIQICACSFWNNSGIKVNEGEEYKFEVANISQCWQDNNTISDPRIGWTENSAFHKFLRLIFEGHTRTNVTDIYALVGTVGQNEKNAFAVLNYDRDPIKIMTGKDEELFFFANDRVGYYYNNKGVLNLRITKVKESN
ncbi:MAG: hypothetical protein A4S08_11510 [Proteobacteria bacterium SG_bin4]|nr:MAG: hypothetical protein A4S08_11510 [Proteobacteria bacterium SG_bin4]